MESQEAAKNIAEIAAVEGVDCIQMGPLDLRSDMGLLRMPNDERPTEMLRYAPSNIPSSESLPSSMTAHVTKSTQVALEETLNVRDYYSQ
jgi:2-keto-3-deoxy-L-rhamnonate aldolase RhmA